MTSLKGTKTAENLMKAFAGESQASNRYTIFSAVAEEEGYKQISRIFKETAENEREHAKRFYQLLVDGLGSDLPADIEITACFPVAKGTTLDNLRAAAAGENEEWTDLYPEFAQIAQEEGFREAAVAFKMIALAEKRHEVRYNKLAENVAEGKVFKKDEAVAWKCDNCGYIHEGKAAPGKCPACGAPQGEFEVFAETY